MHKTRALLLLFVLLIFMSPAGAVSVTFTGNVDTDFAGKPGLISQPDIVTDPASNLAGCQDQPLGPNSFTPPPAPGQTPPSGFNLERVVSVYDCTTDTLYLGLDVCDGKIAWDADGNGDILTKNPNILPGFTLREVFVDDGLEDYDIDIDVNDPAWPATLDMRVLIKSEDGGMTVATTSPVKPAGVTVDAAVTGVDVEVAIHGFRKAFATDPGRLCLPIVVTTRSGATGDLVDEDITISPFDLCCTNCLSITKGVACSADGPFKPSVQVLRGATAYFQIAVTNCGTDNLKDVVITDSFTTNGACCPGGSCIPISIPVGNLAAGETRTFTYPVPTNPAFNIPNVATDCTNTASVSGVGVLTGMPVSAGPASASIDVLVPSITCSKLVDDDSNFSTDPSDNTPPTNNLDLAVQPFGIKQAYYQFCVTNNGETPVDFTAGTDPNCPAFTDDFIKPGGYTVQLNGGGSLLIPGTDQDLNDLFRDQIPEVGGKRLLGAGQTVCVVVGPVTFDETQLCATQSAFTDTFSACGKAAAASSAICLPPGGGETVGTGNCTATVQICPPKICITKEVSCSPDSGFGPSATALRGATVYFKITVTNCGGVDLKDIAVSDTMNNSNGALLPCTGCTIDGLQTTCIPGTFNISSLAVGASKTILCTVPTNPAFSTIGISPDATNTAEITAAKVASTDEALTTLPPAVSATVNVLVPGISCSKLVADNEDMVGATQHLNLSDAVMDTEQAYYKFCVTNTGETDVSFAASGQNCPGFADTFIKVGGFSIQTCSGGTIVIPGTSQDLNDLFRTRLTTLFGSQSLPAGQSVCVTVGPVSFDENQLCCVQKVFPDTFSACGLATGTGICLPPGGGENVSTGNCTADVTICSPPCIQLTKEVSCSPDSGFGPSVTALRGATVYFKMTVTNCGGDNLKEVAITDTIDDQNDALLACTGCTIDGSPIECIPGTLNVGDLAVGQSKTIICTVPTNPDFETIGINPDATNTASASGKSVRTDQVVSAGPVSAAVDLLVPDITCSKLVDNDSNFTADPSDDTPPTTDLNIAQLPIGVKQVWYQICLENTGEVKVDFAAGAGDCPGFTDAFLETADAQIPGTGVDVDALIRSALTTAFGGEFLPAGQQVCIPIGPITLDENVLCPERHTIVNEFSACGIATDTGICLPAEGGEAVETGTCTATVRICPVNICITKGVSCSPAGPFLPTATALRGSTIYFQIVVTNCGGETLNNVTLTDNLTEAEGNPLLACGGCTNLPHCIPGVFNLDTLAPGDSKTIVCTYQTNPAFSVEGNAEDAINTASATGTGAVSGTVVSDGPVTAKVDVLVPSITCELLMDDDANMSPDPADMTPPDNNLNLAINGPPQIEQVWSKLTVTNTGEVDCNFAPGPDPDCPTFWDPFLSEADPDIPGTGQDIAQLFRDAIQSAYGGDVLPAHQSVSITVGPITLDETALCPNRTFFMNRFQACGIATDPDICLPPGGGENVGTGLCQGTITICQPVLFQAYPGDSNGVNVHYGGYLGTSGDTISAVPGVFQLVPGDNWENFVTAAEVGIQYALKNVTLIKQTPKFIQCADVFPEITVAQQGTPNIRLRWPLMFEAPGTQWTLTVAYGTNFPWDDDGVLGPHVAGYYHEDKWTWKVEATLESMKLLLALFHEVPFATDEVPLISDESLYPILQAKLDNIQALYEADRIEEAARALGEFEMEVSDACIATSPREPGPTGPGTGIANSDENPACCKILVDAEHVGFALGLFQASK